jgi:predicted permease
MRSFWQDLRYAARTLRKSPSFTIIAVVTLGLGMAVNTTVFSVINGLILRPLPVPNPEQLVVLGMKQEGIPGVQKFSYPDYQDIASQSDVFRDVFAYRVALGALAADGKGEHCLISRVSGNYFSALQIKPALGRLILPTEGRTPGADPVVVLGYSYWQKRFGGDPGVIGKQVEINRHTVTIVGVTPKGFHGTYAIIDMDGYIPLSSPAGSALSTVEAADNAVRQLWTSRDDRSIVVMGRLKQGLILKEAQARLSVIGQRMAAEHPEVHKGVSFQAFPEKLARPDPDPANVLPAVAVAFTVLAALVLLVACFNIANVLLVRATVRQREMGIRAALGAGRGRLVRQHLTESLVLALLGGGAGLLLGTWAAGFLSALPLGTDLPITFDFQPDARVYFFALGAVIATGLVVGVVPALRVARSDVNSVLREGGRGASDGPRRHFARNALVVAQLAGCMVLLIVAGLFIRSLGKAQQTYLGFDPQNILDLSMDVRQAGYDDARGRELFRQIDERIGALPGVVSVAQAFSVPLGVVSMDDPIAIEGQPAEPGKPLSTVMFNPVTPRYFETLRIGLLSGRLFTDGDTEKQPRVAVINETMAKKFWPNQEAIGKRFSLKGPTGPSLVQVVGIVRDGKYKGVVEEPQSFFYVPLEQNYVQSRTVHVRTSVPPESLAAQVAAQVHELAPNVIVAQVETMQQALQGLNGFFFFRFGAQLSGTMGLLGLVLAVVGVYSVVSYAAVQRTHEIGIRMALGAAPAEILRMVLRQNLGTVVIGIAIGLAAALAGTRAIASLLVGVGASDPLTFGIVAFLLSSVALAACWVPARRATRVSPLVALRYE